MIFGGMCVGDLKSGGRARANRQDQRKKLTRSPTLSLLLRQDAVPRGDLLAASADAKAARAAADAAAEAAARAESQLETARKLAVTASDEAAGLRRAAAERAAGAAAAAAEAEAVARAAAEREREAARWLDERRQRAEAEAVQLRIALAVGRIARVESARETQR
jgi:hypothetical protein